MKLNGISVVIASKGRVKLLEDLLISLSHARNNFDKASEVILVDDSNKEDKEKIIEICRNLDVRLINFGPSVAEKRNVGAKNAKYDIILFLDSDCLASENLLNEHFKLYEDEKIGGVAGYLEFVGEDTFFWQAVDKTPFTICFSFPKWMDTVPRTPTANFSVRKEIFEEISGFDRTFPDKPGGEDVDLGLRMTKAGHIIKCNAKALVYHSKATWIPFKAMFRRLWYYGQANYYLAIKHPDYLMKIMPRKTFLSFIVILTIVLTSILSKNPINLLGILVWIILDLSLSAIFINKFASYKKTTFVKQVIVQVLILVNEMGYIWTCIRKRKFNLINQDLVYFDGQMDGIQDTSAIILWSNLINLTIIAILLLTTTIKW